MIMMMMMMIIIIIIIIIAHHKVLKNMQSVLNQKQQDVRIITVA